MSSGSGSSASAGVSPELLRAWERRYGLLRPTRSAGGLRLYSPADVERVRLMRRHLADGLAAAEAAALALRAGVRDEAAPTALRPGGAPDDLAEALDRFDEPRAQAILDRLLAMATVDTLLSDVVLPYLRELGERWERGDASMHRSTSPPASLRGRYSAWPAAGASGSGRWRYSPACPGSSTTSA